MTNKQQTTIIKKLTEAHKFFIKESGPYLGKWTVKNILYFPVAYTKFMYACIKNHHHRKNYNRKPKKQIKWPKQH